MRPIVDGLQADFGDEVTFAELNAAEGTGLQAFRQLGLPGHPAFVIFSTGQTEVYRVFGIVSNERLREAIEDHLSGG